MSNSTAIAAVTATLRNLLTSIAVIDSELTDATVSTEPPDLARNDNSNNQLNLFLYRTTTNTAFSNIPMRGQVKQGESGIPPLSLNLHYLLTSYGYNNDDVNAHRLLGHAMSVLHDHPILGRDEIQAALADTDLHNQIERIRITIDDMTLDDMSKLWNSFQTQYRLSANYLVSVVLIESSRSIKTPLPVLTRGENDSGINSQPDLIPPYPYLSSITPPNSQPAVRLGELVTLQGYHLDGDNVNIHFHHPRLPEAIVVPAEVGGTAEQISVLMPDVPASWMCGIYNVAVVINKTGDQERTTNALPVQIAPAILEIAKKITLDTSGKATVTITCKPEVSPEQRAALLLGDREFPAEPHTAKTDTLTFKIHDIPTGKRYARLRIDGTDSLLVNRSVLPPVFDSSMEVTIDE
jgi:hypothetical protein